MMPRAVSQVDRAYTHLQSRILNGSLRPGARIEIDEVMQALDISRQPIRDAINRLSFESFVEVIPQVGCVVAVWDGRECADALRVGALIEAEVCALAAARRTEHDLRELESLYYQIEVFLNDETAPEADYAETYRILNRRFHSALCACTGSPSLEALANSFVNRCDFAFTSSPRASGEPLSMRDVFLLDNRGHRAMLDAIERGDPAAARAVSKGHTDELAALAT